MGINREPGNCGIRRIRGPTIPNLDDNLACFTVIMSALPVVSVTASCEPENAFAVTGKESMYGYEVLPRSCNFLLSRCRTRTATFTLPPGRGNPGRRIA